MIELGFKQIERLTKANNFKGRLEMAWLHIRAAWYSIRYGGTKIIDKAPNYITEKQAKDLICHLAKQLGVLKSESK